MAEVYLGLALPQNVNVAFHTRRIARQDRGYGRCGSRATGGRSL